MLICNAVLTDADGARPGDVRIENGETDFEDLAKK